MQRKYGDYRPGVRESLPPPMPPAGFLSAPEVFTLEGQETHQYLGNRYHMCTFITKCKELKADGQNYSYHGDECQAPSALLAPLYFFQPCTPSTPSAGSPREALLEARAAPGPPDASISPSWALQHFQ